MLSNAVLRRAKIQKYDNDSKIVRMRKYSVRNSLHAQHAIRIISSRVLIDLRKTSSIHTSIVLDWLDGNKSRLTLYPIEALPSRARASGIVAAISPAQKGRREGRRVARQASMESELNSEIYRVNNRVLIYDFLR